MFSDNTSHLDFELGGLGLSIRVWKKKFSPVILRDCHVWEPLGWRMKEAVCRWQGSIRSRNLEKAQVQG